jgi:hypothetical protein
MQRHSQLHWFGAVGAGFGLAVLQACAPAASIRPSLAPATTVQPLPQSAVRAETAASAEARMYYAQVQTSLLASGMLRTDGGGKDTPYTDRMLSENFLQIALHDEYERLGTKAVAGDDPTQLRRWNVPVRVGLRFGASISPDKRATDSARVASYLGRLARITGHPIRLDDTNPNFVLAIVAEDERAALGPVVAKTLPQLTAQDISGLINPAKTTYCAVYVQSDSQGNYSRAFAVIRAEHPDLLRLSCLHEEIAQGLGLPNDSPRARPSIFNDDEEFALLTGMDEHLLQMLYDPMLRPGMTETEARPIVETLAARILGGAS